MRGLLAGEAVFDLVAAHQHQRDQDLFLVCVGQPGHVLVDDPLHHVAAVAQAALRALEFGEAELVLIGNERRKGGFQVGNARFEQGEVLAFGLGHEIADRLQVRHRGVVRLAETGHESGLRLRHEVLGAHLHGGERFLEGAARLGEVRGLLHAFEGRFDRPLARQVGDCDCREAHDGDQRQYDQARAHRDIGAEAGQEHSVTPEGAAAKYRSMQAPKWLKTGRILGKCLAPIPR